MPKIKLKTNINTNKSDNTTIKPFTKDLRTVDKKKKDLEDYKKSQRFGKAVQNIIGQTALDQVDFSYTQGLKNTPKSFNLGTKVNTSNDINDINNYNNKYLGVINAGLNTLKVPAPIVGDAAINTLQEGIQYYDEENPTELSKIKNLPQNVQNKIVNKPFGYNYSFAKGGIIPKYGNGATIGSIIGGGIGALGAGLVTGGMGAGAGFTLGSSIGGSVGSLGEMAYDEMGNPINNNLKALQQYQNVMGRPNNSTFGIKTNNQSMYANGGMKVVSNNHFNPTDNYIDAPELGGYFRKKK